MIIQPSGNPTATISLPVPIPANINRQKDSNQNTNAGTPQAPPASTPTPPVVSPTPFLPQFRHPTGTSAFIFPWGKVEGLNEPTTGGSSSEGGNEIPLDDSSNTNKSKPPQVTLSRSQVRDQLPRIVLSKTSFQGSKFSESPKKQNHSYSHLPRKIIRFVKG